MKVSGKQAVHQRKTEHVASGEEANGKCCYCGQAGHFKRKYPRCEKDTRVFKVVKEEDC